MIKVIDATVLDNLVDNFTDERLDEIASKCVTGYENDKSSRAGLEEDLKRTAQNFTVDRSGIKSNLDGSGSNLGLPVIATAALQFQSRASQEFLPAKDIVKSVPIGDEAEDIEKANRTQKYMNYQYDYKMVEFRESFEISLLKLGLDGTLIRKVYFDPSKGRKVQDWVNILDFVINAQTKYLSDAERYTQHVWISPNAVKQNIESGFYKKYKDLDESEFDKGTPAIITDDVKEELQKNEGVQTSATDEISLRLLLEQHVIMNLEGDKPGSVGQPYIITIDYKTRKILRISKRINPLTGEKMDYFEKYTFFPNPSGFYGKGLGLFLNDTNESMNRIINDLLDAGFLNNTKTGIVLEGAGMKKGDIKLEMGKFSSVKLKTDDVRKAFQEFRFSEPSSVLFALLGTLQQYADKVTSISEVSLGALPKSGTTATATAAAIEQGLKLFNGIYKRIHDSYGKEHQKSFVLNSIYLDVNEYFNVVVNKDVLKNEALSMQISMINQFEELTKQTGEVLDADNLPIELSLAYIYENLVNKTKQAIADDFNSAIDIRPTANINIISKQEKAAKAQFIYETTLSNPLTANNPESIYNATVYLYESVDIPKNVIDSVVKLPQPPEPAQDIHQIEENAMIMQGEIPIVIENQDHQSHIDQMVKFQRTAYFEEFTPEQLAVFNQHFRTHRSYQYMDDVVLADSVEKSQQQQQLPRGD
jgi:hypothetical protein